MTDLDRADMVNHPPHYKSGDLEAIDVLEAFFPDDPLGWQVGKYILRYRRKNGLEDLKKAQWYLNRLIGKFEGGADAVPTDERAVPTDELELARKMRRLWWDSSPGGSPMPDWDEAPGNVRRTWLYIAEKMIAEYDIVPKERG